MTHMNSTLNLGKGLKLANRVIVPAMASTTATKRGCVTPQTIEHYRKLLISRASMVIVEYSYIHQSGRSERYQVGIDDDRHIPGLKTLATMIKASGSIALIQLTHAGGKSSRQLTDGSLLSPSGITVPHHNNIYEKPDEANLSDIVLLQNSFIKAAQRAAQSGFDGIELHAAHGYGLNQWISPLTNKRMDAYGGTQSRRLRILTEMITEIKSQFPGLLVSIRIPGQDYIAGGLNLASTPSIAHSLEKVGVDLISVSSGLSGWRRPRNKQGEGYLVEDAMAIKSSVSIPVIGVGGIESPNYINQALNKRKLDLAAIGRAILNNPYWGEQHALLNNL